MRTLPWHLLKYADGPWQDLSRVSVPSQTDIARGVQARSLASMSRIKLAPQPKP